MQAGMQAQGRKGVTFLHRVLVRMFPLTLCVFLTIKTLGRWKLSPFKTQLLRYSRSIPGHDPPWRREYGARAVLAAISLPLPSMELHWISIYLPPLPLELYKMRQADRLEPQGLS
jgi:hypothetical protein